ncbi:MAG: alpha/beta hydrolase [Actinomycetota bacterium]
MTAADGRSMGVAQWGDPGGTPVLSLHGTPGSRLRRPPNEEAVCQAGINLVTYDRPGYGVSDRAAGRRVVDCVGDVEAIVDALGISRFAVTGHSGGGPHALAVAARLPDRVAQAECVVGVAPTADPAKVFSDDWQLADNDRQLLARPDVQLVLVEMMGEAFRPGVWGWVDDDLAFLRARGAST